MIRRFSLLVHTAILATVVLLPRWMRLRRCKDTADRKTFPPKPGRVRPRLRKDAARTKYTVRPCRE